MTIARLLQYLEVIKRIHKNLHIADALLNTILKEFRKSVNVRQTCARM